MLVEQRGNLATVSGELLIEPFEVCDEPFGESESDLVRCGSAPTASDRSSSFLGCKRCRCTAGHQLAQQRVGVDLRYLVDHFRRTGQRMQPTEDLAVVRTQSDLHTI